MPENKLKKEDVAKRLREWGEEKYGGNMAEFARALKMKHPQQLYDYLSGKMLPGNAIQARMHELGMDVVYIMTGQRRAEVLQEFNSLIGKVAEQQGFFRATTDDAIVLKIIGTMIESGAIKDGDEINEETMRRAVRLYRVGMNELNKKEGEG